MELSKVKSNECALQPFELNSIKPGHYVKLKAITGETFWARIMRRYSDGSLDAEVEHVAGENLKRGDRLKVNKINVFEIV